MQAADFIHRYQDDWTALWQRLAPRPPAQSLLTELVTHYCEPHRAYHTLQHLDACLRHLAAMGSSARHTDEVALALWFHDAVYRIGAADNEQRSADWAVSALRDAGGAAQATSRVHALIMVTRHDQPPATADQELLLDIDLAILGAPAAVFDGYERQIVREYAALPQATFRDNRRRILQGFLDRPRIYHTPQFLASREAQARDNLARSIAALTA